jgi:transcriptional regulator with XRE-family HTH domain
MEAILLEKLAHARNIGAIARNSGIALVKPRRQTAAMSIHKRIKARRVELGMSMKTLAVMCGYSSWQTVQQWETEGGTAPKRSKLPRVAKALRVTEEWLSTGHHQSKDVGVLRLTELSPFESKLVLLCRSLSDDKREELLATANNLANQEESQAAEKLKKTAINKAIGNLQSKQGVGKGQRTK